MRTIKASIGSTLVGLFVVIGFALGAAPAQASQADGNYATCQSGTTAADWTGKDPSKCKSGTYLLVKDWKTVVKMEPTGDGWKYIKEDYAAAQKWCSDNALTCGVLTAAGFALVNPLISAATS
ncbi:hypothetical protein [Arthrobacter rhombi]|uniref:hypothetical protein n=1 Tax=Arthrobacter rhombi TaxID=71253 RepID=UPI003F912FA1